MHTLLVKGKNILFYTLVIALHFLRKSLIKIELLKMGVNGVRVAYMGWTFVYGSDIK